MALLLSSHTPPPPNPLYSRFWEKKVSPASAGIAPAQPNAASCFSNRYQSPRWSDLSILPLRESFFFFFSPPLLKLTARLTQSGQRGRERRGAAFQRSHSSKEEIEKNFSSKPLALYANNNTALTK